MSRVAQSRLSSRRRWRSADVAGRVALPSDHDSPQVVVRHRVDAESRWTPTVVIACSVITTSACPLACRRRPRRWQPCRIDDSAPVVAWPQNSSGPSRLAVGARHRTNRHGRSARSVDLPAGSSFSYQAILSSNVRGARARPASPSPSTSAANTHRAPSAAVEISSLGAKFSLPSCSRTRRSCRR